MAEEEEKAEDRSRKIRGWKENVRDRWKNRGLAAVEFLRRDFSFKVLRKRADLPTSIHDSFSKGAPYPFISSTLLPLSGLSTSQPCGPRAEII